MRMKHGIRNVVVFGLVGTQTLAGHRLQVVQSRLHGLRRNHRRLAIWVIGTIGCDWLPIVTFHGWVVSCGFASVQEGARNLSGKARETSNLSKARRQGCGGGKGLVVTK